MEKFENMCDNKEIYEKKFLELRDDLWCEVNDKKKIEFEYFKKNFPNTQISFELFCNYTQVKWLNDIWEYSLFNLCSKWVPPNYVNQCFYNQSYLDNYTFNWSNIIDLYDKWISPSKLKMFKDFMYPDIEWAKKIDFISYKYIDSLIRYLYLNKNKSVNIWKTKFDLNPTNNRFNIYCWMINTAQSLWYNMSNESSWDAILSIYQSNIESYIEQWDKIDTVFFIWVNKNLNDMAFSHLNSFRSIYKNLSSNFIDYSEDTNLSVEKLIENIKTYTLSNPNKRIIVHIWLHWNYFNWVNYNSWIISKENLDMLRQLTLSTKLEIVLDSCYWWQSFSDLNKWNFIITSNKWVSINFWWANNFLKSYNNWIRNFNELNLLAMASTNVWNIQISNSKIWLL